MDDVLYAEEIVKQYPGVVAVNHVSLRLAKGEVLALLGENGAGKSTITKIISGALKPDGGGLYMNGEPVTFDSSHDAMRMGIGMVFQELSMVGDMSVAENVFMNRQPIGKSGVIRWNQLYDDTKKLLEKFNLNIDPRTPVKNLSVGTQQLLEILKAVSLNPKVIILDEPTSSLTDREIELMFKTIRIMKSEGCSFIYITHKLSEVFEIADRITVMRDGKYVDSKAVNETSESEIVRMMVGREILDIYGPENKEPSECEAYFKVEGLSAGAMYNNVSLSIRKGEIVGIAGLIGAGRSEMAMGIFGAHKHSGDVYLGGNKLDIKSPADALKSKIAYLTEDRKKLGLYLAYSIRENLIATNLKRYTKNGAMSEPLIESNARSQIKKYGIATPSVNQKVGNLSGGNQQKCLLSMSLNTDPEVLLCDEPTRGVDVGAKAEIYAIIKEYVRKGCCIMLISSELPELMGMSDRILVMHNGTINGEIPRDLFSEDLIMEYATGIRH